MTSIAQQNDQTVFQPSRQFLYDHLMPQKVLARDAAINRFTSGASPPKARFNSSTITFLKRQDSVLPIAAAFFPPADIKLHNHRAQIVSNNNGVRPGPNPNTGIRLNSRYVISADWNRHPRQRDFPIESADGAVPALFSKLLRIEYPSAPYHKSAESMRPSFTNKNLLLIQVFFRP